MLSMGGKGRNTPGPFPVSQFAALKSGSSGSGIFPVVPMVAIVPLIPIIPSISAIVGQYASEFEGDNDHDQVGA